MRGTPGSRHDEKAPAARRDAPVRAVFLVGFMGAGKTSVGRALSRYLGWRFEDLDDRIQAREGRTVPEIFQRSGESGFRKAELAALRELLEHIGDGQPLIAALGGGAFAQEEVVALLAGSGGVTLFLDAPPDELWRRCGSDVTDRPLRREESEFRRLYEMRRPKYLQASVKIETGGQAIEQIVCEIASRLNLNHRASGEEK
ncbi:MAG TPA: shikimate kinase [Terriglobales bacterium]|nr:shikimate kinase [Terriglobales bacterium]